jgi:hypothetical protein
MAEKSSKKVTSSVNVDEDASSVKKKKKKKKDKVLWNHFINVNIRM